MPQIVEFEGLALAKNLKVDLRGGPTVGQRPWLHKSLTLEQRGKDAANKEAYMYDPPPPHRHNLSTGYHRNNGRACCHEVAVARELLLLHPQRLESDRRLHCAVQIAVQCITLHCIEL